MNNIELPSEISNSEISKPDNLNPDIPYPDILNSENVSKFEINGKKIFIVGTAHISEESVSLTRNVIQLLKPDVVAVELCSSRYQSLKDPDRWKNTDILTVLKEGKALILLSQLILASFQKKLGSKLNIKPGAEMLEAVNLANEQNANIALVDRDVKVTLKRTWRKITLYNKMKILFTMVSSLFVDNHVSKDEIESLKSPAKLNELLSEFTKSFPDIHSSLVDERDMYMSQKIKEIDGKVIVAVIGAGHLPGISNYINKDFSLEELSSIPPKSVTSRILSLIIPATIISILILGFINSGIYTGSKMLWSWILVTGISTSIGALLALAHPLTILITFIVAPFTALNPFLRTGWISAFMEAVLKKPRVSDLEDIIDDICTVKGWYRNRLSRILLILIMVNIFGLIGGIYGIKLIASYI